MLYVDFGPLKRKGQGEHAQDMRKCLIRHKCRLRSSETEGSRRTCHRISVSALCQQVSGPVSACRMDLTIPCQTTTQAMQGNAPDNTLRNASLIAMHSSTGGACADRFIGKVIARTLAWH